MLSPNHPSRFWHSLLGECIFVRCEGVDWIVRQVQSGNEYRFPPARRRELSTSQAFRGISAPRHENKSDEQNKRQPASINRPTVDSTGKQALLPLDEEAAKLEAQLSELPVKAWQALQKWDAKKRVFNASDKALLNALVALKAAGLDLTNHQRAEAGRLLFESFKAGFSLPTREHLRPSAAEAVSPENLKPRSRVQEPSAESRGGASQRFGPSEALSGWNRECLNETPAACRSRSLGDLDARGLRRLLESLRTGLPPAHVSVKQLAVGTEMLEEYARQFLETTDTEGGDAIDIRGMYGQGKSFTLDLIAEIALESGFVVARTEINADEYRLDKPHNIYRGLLHNLRVPNVDFEGAKVLLCQADQALRATSGDSERKQDLAKRRRQWLEEQIGCKPLSWLLADPNFLQSPILTGAFLGEPTGAVREVRQTHILGGKAYDWPTFTYGTQGDIACCLLSGLARLTRLLRYRGLIIIFDEMEKWQDLDWQSQARAGNLLGGLIWSATAPIGRRRCKTRSMPYWRPLVDEVCDHSEDLVHSGWCGGFPFSTIERCHLGIAIAMTPRGEEGPEAEWQQYGALRTIDLPVFTRSTLEAFFEKLAPQYQKAYDLPTAIPSSIFAAAYERWRAQGSFSARSGVTAVVEVLDEWRDRNGSPA